jgi:hypothetical protein
MIPKTKTKKRVNNPNGRPLTIRDERGASELVKLVNAALLKGEKRIRLKTLSNIISCDYHALWSAYNGRRKMTLATLVKLCELLDIGVDQAALIYMRQPIPAPAKKKEPA